MQIGRPPGIDAARSAEAATLVPNPLLRQGQSTAPAADLVDIRPLSIAAVLQILIGEVLEGWSLPLPASRPDAPLGAAVFLVQTFLQALPEGEADPQALLGAHDALLAALVRGMDSAQEIVAAWRNVPRESQDALRQARVMVLAAIGEERSDPRQGAWVMRPEWLELAPRLEELRRRRRRARRRLLDPDLPWPAGGEKPPPADQAP
jgi:hypothetical protein